MKRDSIIRAGFRGGQPGLQPRGLKKIQIQTSKQLFISYFFSRFTLKKICSFYLENNLGPRATTPLLSRGLQTSKFGPVNNVAFVYNYTYLFSIIDTSTLHKNILKA